MFFLLLFTYFLYVSSICEPYMEILTVVNNNTYNLYSTTKRDTFFVVDKNQLNLTFLPETTYYNDKRFYMWDEVVYEKFSDEKLQIQLYNGNYLTLELKAILTRYENYSSVQRNNKWIYYKDTIIYVILRDSNLYIMQSASNEVLDKINCNHIIISDKNHMILQLNETFEISASFDKPAIIIQDLYKNSYQMVPKDSILYEYLNASIVK